MSHRTSDHPSRRALLSTVPAVGAATALGSTTAAAATERTTSRNSSKDGVMDLSWLGTAGWRLVAAGRTVLIDPFLTRFPTGLAAGNFDPTTPLSTAPDEIDPYAAGADTVLVSHTHWDHVADVPYVARTTGAQVFGTLTTCHVLSALDVPTGQLSMVEGDEVLALGDLVLRVISARHSRNARGAVLFSGVRTEVPEPPSNISELPEGGTLAFSIDVPDGPRCLFLGASDFSEANLAGLAPDLVTVPVPSSDATFDYVARLLDVLDKPRTVVPVHWDEFESPLRNPPKVLNEATAVRLRRMVDEIARVSPRSKVIMPTYAEPLVM